MISALAQEIEKWIAEHHGAQPKSIRVSQSVMDLIDEDMKRIAIKVVEKGKPKGTYILGIPVLLDPTLMIGKIDP